MLCQTDGVTDSLTAMHAFRQDHQSTDATVSTQTKACFHSNKGLIPYWSENVTIDCLHSLPCKENKATRRQTGLMLYWWSQMKQGSHNTVCYSGFILRTTDSNNEVWQEPFHCSDTSEKMVTFLSCSTKSKSNGVFSGVTFCADIKQPYVKKSSAEEGETWDYP